MMVLNICNTLASINIDTAKLKFKELTLSNFSGENVSSINTLVLKYFKVIQSGHYLHERIATGLLLKSSKTEMEIFNCKVLEKYSTQDKLEREFILKDQSLMQADSRYDVFGLILCCGFLQEKYELLHQKIWEATTSILTQGNVTPNTNT